jgi:cystathionine beta-lyase/cystathionine gamma-synthase
VLQVPLELGADVVLHSCTKFLGGHSDLLGGALITNHQGIRDRLWRQRMVLGIKSLEK